MNIFNYTLRYLLVLAQAGYEENYWDQVLINDLWVKVLTTKGDDCLRSRGDWRDHI